MRKFLMIMVLVSLSVNIVACAPFEARSNAIKVRDEQHKAALKQVEEQQSTPKKNDSIQWGSPESTPK